MKKVPFFNDTPRFQFVGGVMVPPYSTREVDASLLPPEPAQETETDTATDSLAELLKGTVSEVNAALEDLSLDDIERLGDLEQAGQQRKGILGAIAERLLNAASAMQSDGLQD